MAKSIKLKNDTYIDSASIVHNRELLSNILNAYRPIKNDILFDYANIETGKTYTLNNGKKFSDYKLIEFSSQKTSNTKSYITLTIPNANYIQLSFYETPASSKTKIIIEIQCISDTQFKCIKAGYTADDMSRIDNNPYPIVIRGIF